MEFQFKTAVELLELAAKREMAISEITLLSEAELQQVSREDLLARMLDYYRRMKESVHRGLEITERSKSGLSGGDARRLFAHSQSARPSVLGGVFERSLAYGLAVLETNAAFGRIVATPTAGSAGIVPATLLTWQEERGASDEETSRGVFAAAGVGKIIGHGACFSGAQGGCQAEIGSACSMAAGAICEMDGGTPQQVINAAALALKNTLGLICDPIGGYVEAPCVKRNGLYSIHAFGAAAFSLSGVTSIVPFDEVVGALREVGQNMPRMYKETAEGGLAMTPSGLKFRIPPREKSPSA